MSRLTGTQSGYVALIAVLVISAASLAITTGLLLTASDSQRSTLVNQQAGQAIDLATACAEEALEQIHANTTFTGTNNLSQGQGTCSYTVTNAGGAIRTISATGTVGTTVRMLQINVNAATSVAVTSWQEVGGTPATPAHVQSTGLADGPNVGSSVMTFGSNVTAGNAIIASATWDITGGINSISCSDNKGNSYTVVNQWLDAVNSQQLSICYATNVAAGATTVTVTYGTGAVTTNFKRAIISEYSGIAATNAVDTSSGVGGATATVVTDAVTSGAATTSLNNDLIYGAVVDTTSTTTIVAGTGFTQRFSVLTKQIATQDLVQATAGSIASTQTFGATHRYDAAMVAFKAAQ